MRRLGRALVTALMLAGCGAGLEGEPSETKLSAERADLSGSLSASASASSWYMIWRWPGAPQHDPDVQIHASGGVPPYSYSWQRLSGDPSCYAVHPNSSATGFNNYIPVGDQNAYTSSWRGVVTDSTGATAVTGNIFVSLEVTGYSPGGGVEP